MGSNHFIGKVSDNKDPDGLNRVRVSKLGEEDNVTGWIPFLSPYVGDDNGLTLLPDVDSQVVVVSLNDKNSQQVAMGGIWYNDEQPPTTGENGEADLNQDGKNNLRFLKSRSGSQLIFDDTEGQEKIQILSLDGKSRFEFLVADEIVSLTTENDLTISAKKMMSIQAEEVEIVGKKNVNFDAEELQINAKKTMDFNADKDLGVKGSGISLN